jgi:L-lactate dehydrogenase complex protein LldG
MSCGQNMLSPTSPHQSKSEQALPVVPLFDEIWSNALLAVFKQSLQRMGGVLIEPPINGDVLQSLRDKIALAKVVCSSVPEIVGTCQIPNVSSPSELGNPEFVIVRAQFAVVECGAVLLNHEDVRVNAVAHLARNLIVLLDPADIVVNLQHALRHDLDVRNRGSSLTSATGPAKMEGGLIHARYGMRPLFVLPLAKVPAHRRASASA